MPALHPNADNSHSKILLTGATGYVGQWVLKSLLDRAYDVRVAVRSEGKARTVKDIFSDHEGASKLEFIVVEDMAKVRPGSTLEPELARRRCD